MSINKNKTQIAHFRNPSISKATYDFVIADQNLCIVNKCKCLGFTLTEHLDYKEIVKSVATSAKRALGLSSLVVVILTDTRVPFIPFLYVCSRCQTRNSHNNAIKITVKNVLPAFSCDATTPRPTRHLSRTYRFISGDVV